MVYVFVGIC